MQTRSSGEKSRPIKERNVTKFSSAANPRINIPEVIFLE